MEQFCCSTGATTVSNEGAAAAQDATTNKSHLNLVRPPFLMTVSAVDARGLRLMALHTSAHRDIRLAKELLARRHFPMTFLAGVPSLQMRAVAELHIRRNFVHPRP